jgi:hypothetical protein
MMPSDVSKMYDEGYQQGSVEGPILQAFDWIAEVLFNTFAPHTAIDLGSGGGALVRGLLARGVDAYGVEGSESGVALTPGKILHHDLRIPLQLGYRFDLVTCFDTAEHIEEEFAEVFAASVVRCVSPTGVVVFGAAGEGQDGHGHVNCQHPCYWMERLIGLTVDPILSEHVRRLVKSNSIHSSVWWVAKNLFVLRPR